MPIHRKPALLAALLAAAASVQAQSPADAGGEAPSLEAVTVNARRSIEQRFFAPGSLVVVDRNDIENLGAFSIADVLKQLPGVVVTTNADGSVDIRMRGMDRASTQLLIDGQRTSTGRSQLPLDQLPPEMVERVEVVRSPTAEFSGATGGTINIVLRQATVRRETVVRFTDNIVWGRQAAQAFFSRTGPLFGANPAAKPTGDDPTPEQPWAYFISLADLSTLLGSDVRRVVSDPFLTTTTDGAGRYRRNEISVVPRLNGRLGPVDTLALRGTFNRSRFTGDYTADGVPVPGTAFSTYERQDREREYLQGAADWTHRFRRSKLETTFSTSNVREFVVRDGLTTSATGAVLDTTDLTDRRRENLYTLRSKLTGTADQLLWMFGGEVDRRDLSVENVNAGIPSTDGAVLERRVLWGQNEWEVWNGATFTAGLRGESLTTELRSGGVVTGTFSSSFLQPSLHFRKPITDDLQWRANLARTTRNPRVWDLVDRTLPSQGRNALTNPDNVGNPGLRPERSLAIDTGLETRVRGGGVLGANFFVREVTDAFATLVTQVGGRWVEQRVNVGDARVMGLEFDAKSGLQWLGLGREWNLSAHATLLHSRMTSGVNRGERIPGQPRYTANVTVTRPIRRAGGLFGGGTLSFTGPADLNTSPSTTGRDTSRITLDLHMGQVIRGLGYWRLGVQNIGDAPYDRERRSVNPITGVVTTSSSEMTLTPRVYLSVGTQF